MRFEEIENKDGFYVVGNYPGSALNTDISTTGDTLLNVKVPLQVLWIGVSYQAKDNAGASLLVEKLKEGDASGGGVTIISSVDLTTTTGEKKVWEFFKENFDSNTSSDGLYGWQLERGDRVGLFIANTPGTLRNLNVTLYCAPLGKGDYR